MDNYNIVIIYCSHERPLFLPYYIPDKLFAIEVERQHKFWLHFFHEKRKKQFIPLPWRIGEILLRGITKIDEFAIQLGQYNLKFAEEIKGFDPQHLFIDHMTSVGYSNALTNTFIFLEEEGDSHDPLTQFVEKKIDDIETIVSTNDQYSCNLYFSFSLNSESSMK